MTARSNVIQFASQVTNDMPRRSGFTTLIATCLLVCSSAASAQGTSPASADGSEEARTDLFDLIRKIRKKPPEAATADDRRTSFTIVPIIASKPSTGVKVGGGANIEFVLGDPATTRTSTLNGAVTYSTRGQFGAGESLLCGVYRDL